MNDFASANAPSIKPLRRVKGRLIHLHGLKNLRQSSTFTSSSDATSDSDVKIISSCSSASKQILLGREGIPIPDRGQWSDPAIALDAAVSLPPLSAASVRPFSTSFPLSLFTSIESASVCLMFPLPYLLNYSRFLCHPAICPPPQYFIPTP